MGAKLSEIIFFALSVQEKSFYPLHDLQELKAENLPYLKKIGIGFVYFYLNHSGFKSIAIIPFKFGQCSEPGIKSLSSDIT